MGKKNNTNYAGPALFYRMAGQLEAARQVPETFFTRTARNFSILFDMVHKLSDDLYKKPSFLEMDLFEDFVR